MEAGYCPESSDLSCNFVKSPSLWIHSSTDSIFSIIFSSVSFGIVIVSLMPVYHKKSFKTSLFFS